MNLNQIIEQFSNSQSSIDAFAQVKQECMELIESDPQRASIYYVIWGFCRSFVLLYEEEEMTVEFTDASKTQLLDYMQRLELAINTGSEFDALNSVVSDYIQSQRIF